MYSTVVKFKITKIDKREVLIRSGGNVQNIISGRGWGPLLIFEIFDQKNGKIVMEKSGHAPCITHFLALDQINHLKIVTYIVQGIISLIFFISRQCRHLRHCPLRMLTDT